MNPGLYPRAGLEQHDNSVSVPRTRSAKLCLNAGVKSGTLRDRDREHTDVTDVSGQSRMV